MQLSNLEWLNSHNVTSSRLCQSHRQATTSLLLLDTLFTFQETHQTIQSNALELVTEETVIHQKDLFVVPLDVDDAVSSQTLQHLDGVLFKASDFLIDKVLLSADSTPLWMASHSSQDIEDLKFSEGFATLLSSLQRSSSVCIIDNLEDIQKVRLL